MKAPDTTPGVRPAVDALAGLPQAPPLPPASADTSTATKVAEQPARLSVTEFACGRPEDAPVHGTGK